MRDAILIQEFTKIGNEVNKMQRVINAQTQKIVALEARLRCHEDIALPRGGMLLAAIRNIFAPGKVKADLISRFTAYSKTAIPEPVPVIPEGVEIIKEQVKP